MGGRRPRGSRHDAAAEAATAVGRDAPSGESAANRASAVRNSVRAFSTWGRPFISVAANSHCSKESTNDFRSITGDHQQIIRAYTESMGNSPALYRRLHTGNQLRWPEVVLHEQLVGGVLIENPIDVPVGHLEDGAVGVGGVVL